MHGLLVKESTPITVHHKKVVRFLKQIVIFPDCILQFCLQNQKYTQFQIYTTAFSNYQVVASKSDSDVKLAGTGI